MLLIKHEGFSLAALLVVSVSVTSLPLTAQKPTAQKPIKVDATKLEGVGNFRDIGGYKTADGHTIRYNVLYRSAMLAGMTLADNEKLAPLKIRYEIDLRLESERAQYPTHWGPNPPEVIDLSFLRGNETSIPGNGMPLQLPNNLDPVQLKRAKLSIWYANMAILDAPIIGQVLHDLAQGDEPALIHCAGGTDRTRVTVAVLMTLLGASREDVYQEYVLSGKPLTEAQSRNRAAVTNQPYPPAPLSPELQKDQASYFAIDTTLLAPFFHAIDTKYGSFDAYVRNGLKLSNEDVQNLRSKFLTK